MAIPPTLFLIIIAITAALSMGMGYFARGLDERKKNKESLPTPQSPQSSSPAPVQQNPDEHTALKVSLDKGLAWHLEVDGNRVEAGNISAEQRARLVNILVQIRPWIDGKQAPSPVAAPSAPVPIPAPQPLPVQTPPPPTTLSARVQAAAIPPAQPKIDLRRGVRSLLSNEIKTMEQSKPLSIVAMIDDFLQKRLASSPLADRDVRLEEGALGEVIVMIGKERYPGVDAVPDPQVQAIIRAAIADWERSS